VISPGINNNWARWAPAASRFGERTYHWLAFASWRQGLRYPTGMPISQIFLAAVVTTPAGVTTYPAVYPWNQSTVTSNHTPSWAR
jgi:hypothetical protein